MPRRSAPTKPGTRPSKPPKATRRDAQLRPLWTCPRCGHQFVTANMSHSCRRVALDEHFRAKDPSIRALFDAWHAYVEQFGAFTVLPQKSRICFQTRVRFARAVIRKGHVECSFWLKRRVAGPAPMFRRVEHLPPSYYIYYFNLTDPRQLRARGLRTMVRESYALGWQCLPPDRR